MSKKLSKNIEYLEGYHMIAIVSHLKDYTLCYHINTELKIDLVKYEDLIYSDEENSFSWYNYEDSTCITEYYLVGNKGDNGILIPSQKTVDFFLIVKRPVRSNLIVDISTKLRKINNINAVFGVSMEQIKDMDSLLESIELHELEYVKRRSGNF